MANHSVEAADVEAKFGVSPKQLPDLFALTGDAVDNGRKIIV